MKKICFVTTVPITIETFIIDFAEYYHKNDNVSISFICDFDKNFQNRLPSHFNYFPVRMKRGIDLFGFMSVYKMYKIFRSNKFDLVQYSTPNASFYASIASYFAGIPVRLYCQWGIAYVGFQGVKRKIFKTIEKITCSLSTEIQPDSFGNLEFGRKEGLYTEEKSSVIWNGSASGVDLKKFDIKYKDLWKSEIREKHNIPTSAFVFGFVGRIEKDKGLNELLKAFKELSQLYQDIYLLIAGSDEKINTIDGELLEWSKKESRVIYSGVTKEPQKYYSAMDVFVLPSYREGFGTVVIEAQAMGVPAIVTDIPGPREAIIPEKTGDLVKSQDWLAVKISMKKYLLNKEKLKVGRYEIRKYINNRYCKSRLFFLMLENRKKMINIKEVE